VLIALIGVVNYLAWILTVLVIVQFILSLLISFNVVNLHNNAVAAIWQALNALLEPILRPVRRLLPNTGAIDFSPLVIIVGLNILSMLLTGLANDLRY
jgi:YggT family protein